MRWYERQREQYDIPHITEDAKVQFQIEKWAGTALDNTPSVRLLKTSGFQKVGEEKVSFYKDEKGNNLIFTGGIFERSL